MPKNPASKFLEVIFRGNNLTDALEVSYTLDENPEDLVYRIEKTFPLPIKEPTSTTRSGSIWTM